MVEGIQQGNLPHFTTVKYVTKDGENCTATKNNGVVTVVGDKNGVRQMPLNDFMADFVQNLPKVNLENSPKQDTVSFSGKEKVAQDEGKSSKAALGWLAALGVTVIGAGVYLLTRGKGKNIASEVSSKLSDATETVANKAKTAVETATEKAKDVTGTVAEKVKPTVENLTEKAEDVIAKRKAEAKELIGFIYPKKSPEITPVIAEAPKAPQVKPSAPKKKPAAPTAQAKPEPQFTAPKPEAKPAQPKTKSKIVKEEAKIEPKKSEQVKPQEPKKDTIQEMLDDLDKQQKKAQKLAEQQQKEQQQIIDDNNLIAAAVLLDSTVGKEAGKVSVEAAKIAEKSADEAVSTASKVISEVADDVFGHKPVSAAPAVALADDAGKAAKGEFNIADDLLADAHIDAPKSNPWDEPVDFMKSNGVKAADDVDVLSPKSYFDELDDQVDLFPKSSSYDDIDDMFPTSHYDDFDTDLGNTFDDFNHGLDDFDGGFDDFGGDIF